MAQIAESFYLDGNHKPITNLGLITPKTITFAGATAGAWGNDGGALDGAAIFTVTGIVKLMLVNRCTTNLAGSGTHAVGIATATTIYLPTEAAVDINSGDFVMNNATTTAFPIFGEQQAAADNFPVYMLNGQDIIMTIGTNDIDSGVIEYYAVWNPISSDGSVADAGN